MQPAYIISAYKRPDLLLRLVEVLSPAPVAVHVDSKSDIFAEVSAALAGRPNVALLPRHLCEWGFFGHVEASLEGLKWFARTPADYAILLTGQCYPMQTQAQIAADLRELRGRSIIEHTAFPKPEWGGYENGGFRRVDRFYFKLKSTSKIRSIRPWRRKPPLAMHPYGGSGYWCLSRGAAEHVLELLRRHPEVARYFRTTYVPDETFFQTILANSPLRSQLISALIHYTDWSGGGASPAILKAADLSRAFASGAWFARKFEDHAVLDLVDAERERRGRRAEPGPWRRAQKRSAAESASADA